MGREEWSKRERGQRKGGGGGGSLEIVLALGTISYKLRSKNI